MSSSVGKEFRSKGYQRHRPVLIIPGLCSTAMKVHETPFKEWENQRVWLDLTNLMPMAFEKTKKKEKKKKSRKDAVKDDEPEEERKSRFVQRSPAAAGNLSTAALPNSSSLGALPSPKTRLAAIGGGRAASFAAVDTSGVTLSSEEIQMFKKRRRMSYLLPGRMDEMDELLKRKWIKHVMLQNDGASDPEGIKVRPIPGLEGCAYLDPSIGALTNALSYVFGPLIEILKSLGYDDTSLKACTYDWRLAPRHMEARDRYFTNLKETIEEMYHANQKRRVVLLAHSLGTKVAHYFSRWAEANFGRQWWSTYVDHFFAIGPLWLGAPKSLRATVTGERMGLDFFLYEEEGVALSRKCGSTPWMYPLITPDFEFQSYCQLRTGDEKKWEPRQVQEIMREGKAEQMWDMTREYYLNDPFYGMPEAQTAAPPIDRMKVIYGINIPTEIHYFFKPAESDKSVTALQLDSDGSIPNYKCEGGIAYETKDTRQNILKGRKRAGDGTVPYASMAHCKYWHHDGVEVEVIEIDNADHRAILKHKILTRAILEYVTRPPPSELPKRFPVLTYDMLHISSDSRYTPVTLRLTRSHVEVCARGTTRELSRYAYSSIADVAHATDDQIFVMEYEGSDLIDQFKTPIKAEVVDRIAARCRFMSQQESAEDSMPLVSAAYENRLDLVMTMMMDPGVDVNSTDKLGCSALVAASSKGFIDVVLVLLQHKSINVNIVAKDGSTPMHYLMRHSFPSVSETDKLRRVWEVFKGLGADLEAPGRLGERPLHQAVSRNNTPGVIWLLENGVNPNAKNNLGEGPLHYAVRGGMHQIVRLLVKHGADENMDAPSGTPLAIAHQIDPALFEALSATQSDSRDINIPPFHAACAENRLDKLFDLLKEGVDLNAQDGRGWTGLHVAASCGHVDALLVVLQQKGVKVQANLASADGAQPLHLLAKASLSENESNKAPTVVSLLLKLSKSGDIDKQDTGGETALHYAVKFGNVSIARSLLMHTASPDIANCLGETALHYGVRSLNAELIHMLLEHGANTELKAKDGSTPRSLAESIGGDIAECFENLVPRTQAVAPKSQWTSTASPSLSASGRNLIGERRKSTIDPPKDEFSVLQSNDPTAAGTEERQRLRKRTVSVFSKEIVRTGSKKRVMPEGLATPTPERATASPRRSAPRRKDVSVPVVDISSIEKKSEGDARVQRSPSFETSSFSSLATPPHGSSKRSSFIGGQRSPRRRTVTRMDSLQERLRQVSVTGNSTANLVSITVDPSGTVVDVQIDWTAAALDYKVETLVGEATTDALAKLKREKAKIARECLQEEQERQLAEMLLGYQE